MSEAYGYLASAEAELAALREAAGLVSIAAYAYPKLERMELLDHAINGLRAALSPEAEQ